MINFLISLALSRSFPSSRCLAHNSSRGKRTRGVTGLINKWAQTIQLFHMFNEVILSYNLGLMSLIFSGQLNHFINQSYLQQMIVWPCSAILSHQIVTGVTGTAFAFIQLPLLLPTFNLVYLD